MIKGTTTDNELRTNVKVLSERGKAFDISGVIDTGYTEFLTLPPAVITRLGLPWQSADRGVLADGSVCLFATYVARVIWDGRERTIVVAEADADVLIGMSLMKGYELTGQIWEGGKVTLKKRAARSK